MAVAALWVESSPLAQTANRIGMFESGRTRYALPGRVENLDGKANLAALHAILRGEFLTYLDQSDMDMLVFGDYYEPWLDTNYPEWRVQFRARKHRGGRAGARQASATPDDHVCIRRVALCQPG